MSRILEFQPTDEQTIIARVLVELHQAIDASFPNARPSAKQFSRTVLTNQGESTRIDNIAQPNDERLNVSAPTANDFQTATSNLSNISMTPNSAIKNRAIEKPLHTAQIKTLMGESYGSRILRQILITALIIGFAIFVWILFFGPNPLFHSP